MPLRFDTRACPRALSVRIRSADHGTCSSTDCRTRRAAYRSPPAPPIAPPSIAPFLPRPSLPAAAPTAPPTAPPRMAASRLPQRLPHRRAGSCPQTTAKRGAEITRCRCSGAQHAPHQKTPADPGIHLVPHYRIDAVCRPPGARPSSKAVTGCVSRERRQAATGSRAGTCSVCVFFEAAAIRTSNEPWRPLLRLQSTSFTGRSRRRPDIPSTHRQPRSAPG